MTMNIPRAAEQINKTTVTGNLLLLHTQGHSLHPLGVRDHTGVSLHYSYYAHIPLPVLPSVY